MGQGGVTGGGDSITQTLFASLLMLMLGVALWLSSRTHPAYAGLVVLAVLVWSMVLVARPSRN
jgi:hypothetical protein